MKHVELVYYDGRPNYCFSCDSLKIAPMVHYLNQYIIEAYILERGDKFLTQYETNVSRIIVR